jgi:hypothetical protein
MCRKEKQFKLEFFYFLLENCRGVFWEWEMLF